MGLNKKSQAAMEFLTTYGWAILVVLTAIGALVYFGVFNPCKFNPNIPCEDEISVLRDLRLEKDLEATLLCQNLKKDIEIYPEYKEKTDALKKVLRSDVIYLPESVNLLDNKPRIMRSGIVGNDLYWAGSVEDGIKTVSCIIPSETCFLIEEITTCQTNLDRMTFNYTRWKGWFDG